MVFGKIGKKIHLLIIALFILPAISRAAYALPAFPGAQGWGSDTIGGRSANAKLCKVTSLGDTSSGSCSGNICSGTLRYCIDRNVISGPKIVIFTVGGTIVTTSDIKVYNPYLTIAGQTAPGGGILIKGPSIPGNSGSSSILIATHDVIVRGLRIRNYGDSPLNVWGDRNAGRGPNYNIIVDHNSFSWGMDSNIDAIDDINYVTFSYNIISEAVSVPSEGSEGLLIGTSGGTNCTVHNNHMSVHHNLFAHNNERNPRVHDDAYPLEIINNVIYNWGSLGTDFAGRNYISRNHYIAGNNSSGKGINFRGYSSPSEYCPTEPPPNSVYISHNIGPGRLTDTGDDWLVVAQGTSSYARASSPPWTPSGVTEDDVTDVESIVLNNAGATIPYRDSVDVRIIDDVINGTGSIISDPSQVGGWPTIASGSYPTDTDGDGMPDAWETARGLNPNDPSDWNKDRDDDGYWNIEEYINSFFLPKFAAIVSPIPTPPALIPNPPSIIGIH